VVGGGGDQASSAVGNGIVEPGIVSCTLGTSAWSSRTWTARSTTATAACTLLPRRPRRLARHGRDQGAGLSLQWFRNQLAPGADYDQLTARPPARLADRKACSGCRT